MRVTRPMRKGGARLRRYTRKQKGGNAPSASTTPLFIYYHVFCSKATKDILRDQVAKILFSGLYDVVNEIRCCLVGEPAHIGEARTILLDSGAKFKILAEGPNDTSYERFTLDQIRKTIQPGDKFLYIHTKGVTKPDHDNVYYWRTWLEYCLIKNWRICVEKLDSHDIVGAQYLDRASLPNYNKENIAPPHFSGNFWCPRGRTTCVCQPTLARSIMIPSSTSFARSPNSMRLGGP